MPVAGGKAHDLERTDAPGRRDVRSAAEVHEGPDAVRRCVLAEGGQGAML